jgi:hypothetical protein
VTNAGLPLTPRRSPKLLTNGIVQKMVVAGAMKDPSISRRERVECASDEHAVM